jgi:hypothetical protein
MLNKEYGLLSKLHYHLNNMVKSGYHLKRYHKVPIKYLKVVIRDLPVKYNPKKPPKCRIVIRDLFLMWLNANRTIVPITNDPVWLWTLYYDLKDK